MRMLSHETRWFFAVILLAGLCNITTAKIIYVDDDAAGANDGSSWENAYVYLQDALTNADSAEKPVEIRVAEGIYKPNEGTNVNNTVFNLMNEVTLSGGYAGLTEQNPNERNIELYETILSGDWEGNDIDVSNPSDLLDEPTRSDNRGPIVLSGYSTDPTAILDGFTITGGCSRAVPFEIIIGGGGLRIDVGNPTISNCTFIGNAALASGGGMLNRNNAHPIITNCKFIENYADSGGGVYNASSSPILSHCYLKGNYANDGAGMKNLNEWWRGLEQSCNPNIINCVFSSNYAEQNGGGIYFYEDCNSIIINCTFDKNFGINGRALSSGSLHRINNIQLKNCIIWDGGNEVCNPNGSKINIDYTNLFGGLNSIEDPCNTVIWGIGNIDVDPCFANPGYWADLNDPNVIVEPNDPNSFWIDGDYHLKSKAGRFDPNSENWLLDDVTSLCIDAGDPNSPVGEEPDPNSGRINMGAYGGTSEASKTNVVVYIQWLGHSTVKLWTEDVTVYIDPENLDESLHDATLVCVTHTHGDHYSPTDIAKVSNPETQFIGPSDVVQQYGSGQVILPAQTIDFNEVSITAVAAYNTNKTNHPKANNWVGYIIEFGGKRVYVAGDTDLTDEMKALEDIDVAFLPAGGTYTMNATEAAEATQYIRPNLAIPYHWGQVVGNINDAQTFVALAYCPAMVLDIGETISSEDWPVYSPLIAHWKFDETDGYVASDSARDNDGVHLDEPLWQPDGGIIDGALEFDGIDDYMATPFVVNPSIGPFSVFAWIKGGEPGQVILSQIDCANWLSANVSDGALITELKGGGRTGSTLKSQTVITDNNWHRVGLTWDGVNRILYVDDTIAAQDTQANLIGSEGGLYIGAGNTLDAGTLFFGLIDDVQIYNQAITP